MHIKLIDVPLYYGCDNPGTHLAPMTFSKNQIASLIEERGHQLDRLSIVPTPQHPTDKDAEPTMKYLNEVTYTCRQLADCVHNGRHNGQFPLVIGGDHALGLGSIAGLARSIPADQLSVIWIDAHTDINTNLTSPSHNIHGMPLAAALGLGDSRLYENMGAQAPFLLPEESLLHRHPQRRPGRGGNPRCPQHPHRPHDGNSGEGHRALRPRAAGRCQNPIHPPEL